MGGRLPIRGKGSCYASFVYSIIVGMKSIFGVTSVNIYEGKHTFLFLLKMVNFQVKLATLGGLRGTFPPSDSAEILLTSLDSLLEWEKLVGAMIIATFSIRDTLRHING